MAHSVYIICCNSIFCPGKDISATVRPIGVKILRDGRTMSGSIFFSFGGGVFRGLQMRGQKGIVVYHFGALGHRFLQFDREYLENSKSQRYMSIRTYHQLDERFLKM